ncbi:MAG: FAD-dependent thymidylate synthase, partial [Candidatus Saccharimonadales bacterium]
MSDNWIIYPLGDDIGSIELVDSMGGDLSVTNSARVSFNKYSFELSERDQKLINRMMRNRHGSPFEAVVMQFRVKAPMHVVHQWERHRIASYNE